MKMNELLKLKSLCCQEYKHKWDNALNDRDLADIGLDINGAEWLCVMVNKGMITKSFIKERFADIINGKYVRNKDGYTSGVYVDYVGQIDMHTTLLVIIGGNVEIHVPQGIIGRVFLDNDAECKIIGSDKIEVVRPQKTM